MCMWRIPVEELQAQSRHFRYVSLQRPWSGVGPLHLTQLRTLDITTAVLLLNMDLLHVNSQLSKLTLRFYDKTAYKDIRPALESLSQLTFLRLFALTLENSDELGEFLNNNPGLEELELIYVRGIAGLHGCQPLLNLTSVYLDLYWTDNLGLVQLFKLCPRLESLDMIAVDAPSELQDVLRSHCPRFKSIGFLDDVDFLIDLTEAEAVSWIKLPSQLAVFEASLQLFTNKVYQAFLGHAASLESIKLNFSKRSRDNALYACKLLNLCPKLRHIHITHHHDDDLPRCLDPSLEWFNGLQKHPTLISVKIWGFVLDWQPGNEDGSYEDGWEDSDLDEDDSEGGSDQEDEDEDEEHSGQGQGQSDGGSESGVDRGEGDSEDGLDLEQPEHTGGGSNPGNAGHSEQIENKLLDRNDDGLSNDNQRECTAEQKTVCKTKVPRAHPAEDQEFIDMIASQGWVYEGDHDLRNRVHPNYFISKGARFLRNQIFHGLEGSPNLNKITVGGFVYANKDRIPVAARES
ncbi:hypothetical protein BG000_010347 [Podila horticola]|nr:hypothetical protein BG000_010347 [Podila horticola]